MSARSSQREAALLRPAKTVLQLYGQLLRSGLYSESDLRLVRSAYELGVKLFSFRFQATETPFMSHCLGTASVLAAIELPAPVIAAGLVHNLYFWGDFADGAGRGANPARRARVRAALGETVESYVHGLPLLRRALRKGGMESLVSDVESFDEHRRHLLLVQAADRVDHHLDGPYRTLDEAQRTRWLEEAPVLAEAVRRIGYPALAATLTETCRLALDADVPPELRSARPRSFLSVPGSVRERRVVVLRRRLHRKPRRGRRKGPMATLLAGIRRRAGGLRQRVRRVP